MISNNDFETSKVEVEYIFLYTYSVYTCIFEVFANRILTDQSFDLRLCMETYSQS